MRILGSAVLMLVVVTGCGSGGGGGLNLVGTWRAVTVGKDGSGSIQCPGTVRDQNNQIVASCGASDTYTLGSNGTWNATEVGATGTGTWSLNGSTLTVTVTQVNGTAVNVTNVYTVSENNGQVTVRQTNDPSELGVFSIWRRN